MKFQECHLRPPEGSRKRRRNSPEKNSSRTESAVVGKRNSRTEMQEQRITEPRERHGTAQVVTV
jgi:hypothetical protein